MRKDKNLVGISEFWVDSLNSLQTFYFFSQKPAGCFFNKNILKTNQYQVAELWLPLPDHPAISHGRPIKLWTAKVNWSLILTMACPKDAEAMGAGEISSKISPTGLKGTGQYKCSKNAFETPKIYSIDQNNNCGDFDHQFDGQTSVIVASHVCRATQGWNNPIMQGGCNSVLFLSSSHVYIDVQKKFDSFFRFGFLQV